MISWRIMRHITFDVKISADIEKAFAISTNYANLHTVTNGFYILSKTRSTRDISTLVAHRILVLNNTLAVMIKHVIEDGYVHKSYWVGGDAKGSIISETYEKSENETILHVDAQLKLPFFLALKSVFYSKKLESNLQHMAQGIARAAES